MADRRYKLLKQGLAGDSGFSVGALSDGEVLYFDGTKWQNTDAVSIDPVGAVGLKHSGTTRLETRGDGAVLGPGLSDARLYLGTTATGGLLRWTTGLNEWFSYENGAEFRLRGNDAGGVSRLVLNGDPDGAVTLYSAGQSAAYTNSEGLVTQSNSTHGRVRIYDSANESLSIYKINNAHAELRNMQASQEVRLSGYNGGGSYNPILIGSPDDGVKIGTPASGYMGDGTLNAEGVYDDGTLLTDYVFDAELDGSVDLAKWDRAVPNRRHREEDEDGNVIRDEVEVRRHEPARRFTQRTDDLDPEAYAAKWRTRRKLPAFDEGDEPVQLSLGEYSQRLLETCEVQAIHIDKLLQRIAALEEAVNGNASRTG